MSRSVDLFIDSPLPAGELGRRLAALTRGTCHPPTADDELTLQVGEVRATLSEHSYVDDGALRLSRYRYALSARFTEDRPVNDCPEVLLVRHVAELVRARMDTPALVVLDLELRDPGDSGAVAGGAVAGVPTEPPGEPAAGEPAPGGTAAEDDGDVR
jgi:hypothetical protein